MANFSDKEKAAKKDIIVGALQKGACKNLAAKAAGICRDTIYDWANKDEQFAARVSEACDLVDDLVQNALFRNATTPDPRTGRVDTTACIFWLKNRQPERWREVSRHEHTGKTTVEHKHEHTIPDANRVGRILEILHGAGVVPSLGDAGSSRGNGSAEAN